MNNIFIIIPIMFFAVPIIALFDWLIFMPKLRDDIYELIRVFNETGKVNIPWYTWIPACMLESLFFIAGFMLGFGLIK